VSPEQGSAPRAAYWRLCPDRGHGVAVAVWAWHLGCLILAAGRGPRPAPAVTTGGAAQRRVPRSWPPAPDYPADRSPLSDGLVADSP
jgi:hypothetical protein